MSRPGGNTAKCARYRVEHRAERHRERRIAAFERMVAESRERRATHGLYAGERRRAAKYAEKRRRLLEGGSDV